MKVGHVLQGRFTILCAFLPLISLTACQGPPINPPQSAYLGLRTGNASVASAEGISLDDAQQRIAAELNGRFLPLAVLRDGESSVNPEQIIGINTANSIQQYYPELSPAISSVSDGQMDLDLALLNGDLLYEGKGSDALLTLSCSFSRDDWNRGTAELSNTRPEQSTLSFPVNWEVKGTQDGVAWTAVVEQPLLRQKSYSHFNDIPNSMTGVSVERRMLRFSNTQINNPEGLTEEEQASIAEQLGKLLRIEIPVPKTSTGSRLPAVIRQRLASELGRTSTSGPDVIALLNEQAQLQDRGYASAWSPLLSNDRPASDSLPIAFSRQSDRDVEIANLQPLEFILTDESSFRLDELQTSLEEDWLDRAFADPLKGGAQLEDAAGHAQELHWQASISDDEGTRLIEFSNYCWITYY